MNITKTITAVCAAFLLLTGCIEEEKATGTTSGEFYSDSERVEAWKFVIGQDMPEVFGIDDQTIIDLARRTCEVVRTADTAEEFFGFLAISAEGSGFTALEASAMAGASVQGWCPEELSRLGLD